MKKRAMIFLILAACIFMRAVYIPVHAQVAERDLTLMIYMTGADLESQSGCASADLEEMVASMPEDGNMTVVVLTGGSSSWKNDIASDKNVLWQVKAGELLLIEETEQKNMGDEETLCSFLRKGESLFPAKRYALIFWDHGGGPLAGVCFDERYGLDGLTLNELNTAFRNSNFAKKPLMFIGFDACLMASIEVACAMAPYAEYMIASEEPEPGEGWDYGFLADPGICIDGAQAGRIIVDAYAVSQNENLSPTTLSCLDLSRAEALREEVDSLFGKIAEDMTRETYSIFAECRVDSKVLGAASSADWDLVDLVDLAKVLKKNEAADASALLNEADKMIVYAYSSENRENGLSIYAPFDNKRRYSQPWSDRYNKMNFSSGYQQYVQSFAEIWLASGRVDWKDKANIQIEMERNRISLALPLKGELAKNAAYARLIVLETGFGAKNECQMIYASEALQPKNNMIRTSYSGEALYLLNENGEILGGPVEQRPLGKGIAVPAILEDILWKQQPVYLIWQEKEEGVFVLTEIETYNHEMQMFTVSSRKPQHGDTFLMGGYTKCLPETDDTYKNWPIGDSFIFSNISYTEGTQWRLVYLPLHSEHERFAMFEVVDFQGNTHLSDPISLFNSDKIQLSPEVQIMEDQGLQITLKDAAILTGAYPCLQFDVQVCSKRKEGENMFLETILLNQTAIANTKNRFSWLNDDIDTVVPGVDCLAQLTISAQDLQKARIKRIESLGMVFSVGKDIVTFVFDFPVDTSLIARTVKEETKVLFSAQEDGLVFDILSIEIDVFGNLAGKMHIKNYSGRERVFSYAATAFINGEELMVSIEKDALQFVTLPDGYDAWCDYQIGLQTYEDGEKKEVTAIEPSQIREIQLEIHQHGEEDVLSVKFD